MKLISVSAEEAAWLRYKNLMAAIVLGVSIFLTYQLVNAEEVPNATLSENQVATPETQTPEETAEVVPDSTPLPEPSSENIEPTKNEETKSLGADSLQAAAPVEDDLISDRARTKFDTKRFAQVDESSGMLEFELPLKVPPGRNTMEPSLSLHYSSKPTVEASVMGYGWSLSIPYIQRMNKRGVNTIYSDSYFVSTLSGELATSTASTTQYFVKYEDGKFITYTYANNQWIAKDKSGNIYTFGTTTDSRVDNPSDTTKIYTWMLDEVRDPNGNYVRYEYYKDGGQIYPYKIYYTGNTSTDGIFEVEFGRSSNLDFATSSAPGFTVETKSRINEITAKVNGSWVGKYTLDYATSTNRYKALLKSVTESGRDESGSITTLQPYVFSYQDSDTSGWASVPSWTLPEQFTDEYGKSTGTVFADVNGDGLPDIIRSINDPNPNPDVIVKKVYINNGSGWTLNTSWQLPVGPYFIENGGDDMGYRVFDVNGDGLDDIVRYRQDADRKAYINTGSGWVDTPAWYPPVPFVTSTTKDNGVRIVDINADGLPDLIFANNQTTNYTYLNTGNGWATTTSWLAPYNIVDAQSKDNGLVIVDTNGDNLPDFLRGYKITGSPYVREQYINNGSGWTTYTSIPGLGSNDAFIENYRDLGFRMFDVNGDSETDILRAFGDSGVTKNAFIDTGPKWLNLADLWDVPLVFMDKDAGWKDPGTRIADINGDGMADMVQKDDFGTSYVYLNSSKKVDLLKKVTYPTGGYTAIEYKTAQQYKDGSGNLLNRIQYPLFTVSKITHNDGLGANSEWNYTYANGYYYYGGAFDKKFPGFGLVTRTSPTGDIVKTYYHNATSTTATVALGQYDDHISKAGKVYRTEIANSAGDTYLVTVNTWDKQSLGNDAYYVRLANSLTLSYDGDADHKDTANSYSYDALGNITEKIDWGEVSGNSNGTFSDTGTDKLTTILTYATSTTSYISLPSRETVKDQGGSKIKETNYYYDTQTPGLILKGNLTKKEQWKSGSSYIDSQKTYNSYGLVTEDRDPRSKVTSYEYDAYNLYPATSTNALSQATTFVYDYSIGKPKQVKDSNGFTYVTAFDGVDRVVSESIPDFTTPYTPVVKTSYSYTDSGVPTSIQRTDYLSSSTLTPTYSYFDGLGRIIQVRKRAEASNTYSVVDTLYNSLGVEQKESLPYFSSGTSFASSTADSKLYTSFEYDPLLRVKSVGNVLGTTTNSYDQWILTATDALGKVKDIQKDARGQIISVVEHIATTTSTHVYEYNGLGNLTKLTEEGGALRNFTYDGLGQRLTAEDLHGSSDTSFGTWTYTYDAALNLSTRLDPKSQLVSYTYDDINRVTSEDYNGQAGIEMTYAYDTCTNGKGKLCTAAVVGQATTTYLYNPLGLISKQTQNISGTSYPTQFTYDRQGNITTVLYPDGVSVANNYNVAGLLDSISPYVTNLDYSPLGQVAQINYGNNASTTNSYDAAKLYRLVNKMTKVGTTTLQYLTYTYDPVGNITKIVDTSPTSLAKTVDYSYDDVYRLTSASTTNATVNYLQTFQYNPNGSMTYNSDSGSYTHYTSADTGSYANTHALKTAGGSTYTYDNNGNMTNASTTVFVWNYNNQLTQLGLNGTSTYSYDYEGNRVKTVSGGVTTHYPNKYYDAAVSGTTTKNIYAGDTLLATIEFVPNPSPSPSPTPTPVTYYHHTDHLGSTAVVTNSLGTRAELVDYKPFGTLVTDDTKPYKDKHKFAGTILDTKTGLNYMGARYQDPRIGRFVSQDPVFLSVSNPEDLKSKTGLDLQIYLSDPQGLNSYSYARNNPLKLVDPGGGYYREASTGYVGLKGFSLGLIESTIGVARGNINIARNSSTINGYANGNIIKSIIFEEQSHGLDDIVTDRYPVLGTGKTVGLGQITVNDKNTALGYGSYSRADLLNPFINIREINNRINSISSQLSELDITAGNKDFVGYVSSAYNNQNNLGVLSNYGKRVQAYYNDVSSGKLLVPENNAAGKVIQSLNSLRKKLSK